MGSTSSAKKADARLLCSMLWTDACVICIMFVTPAQILRQETN
jgi:hypothetical protein